MKAYKYFKNAILIVEFLAVSTCLYFWIMNDFDHNLYDFCSKTIVICLCFDLSSLFFEKKLTKQPNPR